MVALAAFIYLAGVAFAALCVAGMVLFVLWLHFIWGAVTVAERARLPRIARGSLRNAPAFALRLTALLCVVACIAALIA